MSWLNNIKTGTKIIGLTIIMAIFVGIVGIAGFYYSASLSSQMDDMYQNYLLSVKWLNGARSDSRAIEALTMEVLNPLSDKAKEQANIVEAKDLAAKFDAQIADYEKTSLDDAEKDKLSKLKSEISVYRPERQKAIEMALAGNKQGSYAYFAQSATPSLDRLNVILTDLANYNAKKADEINRTGKENAKKAAAIIFAMSIISVLVSLLIGILLARLIAGRLNNVVKMLQQVAEGDLAQTIQVMAEDEIGALGHALNGTVTHLRTLVEKIEHSAEQVAASAEELTASTNQSNQATEQIVNAINEVTADTEKQLSAVDAASLSVEEMSAGAQQIAASANSVAEMAEKTSESARNGGLNIEVAVKQMGRIESSVSKTAEVVATLSDRSKEIGQIVDTISGLAGQTNLLALNAAIEAARAGEQGSGFAVVAEEVRKLAEQSKEATKHIASLIAAIQEDTEHAVVTMNEGTEEVKHGSELVGNAGHSFKEIMGLIQNLHGQVREISAAIQQMAGGTQQIVSTVHDIDDISKKTVGQAQTVSSASEEQSASMQEIVSASESLATMAEDLKHVVEVFRV